MMVREPTCSSAAAEATVGLAIVILIYRNWRSIDADRVNLLKW